MSKTRTKQPKPLTPEIKPKAAKTPLPVAFWAICAFLVIATAIVYAQVRHFSFVNLDDGPYVYQNHYIQQPIGTKSIAWAFETARSANWHPLTWISHAIDCQLYGIKNPGGHHITSVLLHIVNTLLLFLLLSRMTGSMWKSGFVAALFALHPLHVESVAWVAERKDVLSTMFLLLTLLAYVWYSSRRCIGRYLLVFCLYALGLMAKPMLVSLPLILLLLDWWPLKRFGKPEHPELVEPTSPKQRWLRRLKGRSALLIEKLPLFALAGASCVVTYLVQLHSGATQTLQAYPIGVRAANAVVCCAAYITKTLWPHNLGVLYEHPGATLPPWQVIAAAVAMLLATTLAILVRRKLPYVFVGWLWYVIMLIPVIGLIQVGKQAMADRYTYVPVVGLLIIITWGVCDAASRLPAMVRRVCLAAVSCVVIAALSFLCWVQVGYWQNTETLARHAIEATNGGAESLLFLASELNHQGKIDQALELLSDSLRDQPDSAKLHHSIGNLLFNEGKYTEAEAHLRKAIAIDPHFAEGHNSLAGLLLRRGRSDEAEAEFRKSMEADPTFANPHFGLGKLYQSRGKAEEALAEFREAVRLDPDRVDARCGVAAMLYQEKRYDEVLSVLRETVELNPDYSNAWYLLGSVLLEQGTPNQVDEALGYLRRSIQLTPKWGQPHNYLAMGLCLKGDYAGSWGEVELARKYGNPVDPRFIDALTKKMAQPRM